ncbi:hypothetical protein X777_07088 [Ooceraea biroi]|uniref:Uncharacterized protein n=1 Tax=Ooceraea biroi TaxID=2015173 RepID=A0A026W9C9_OOCBI|nr:hypothetical protein X777_07088 [Ooceraea biroi]
MYEYMEECRQHLASQLQTSANSGNEARPSDMQGMDKDIVEFQKALEATHDEAIAQKENLREVTTISVKRIRWKL